MAGIPENLTIELACPGCGVKSKHPLAQLHPEKHYTCVGCGVQVEIKGEVLANVDAALRNFERGLAGLSKSSKITIKF